MNIAAFIPARGGSKGIALKNIKPFNGMPLIYWVLKACADSRKLSCPFVATDHPVISQAVKRLGLPAMIFDRNAETATNTASSESAMLEFAEKCVGISHIALIQATSPLLTGRHIDEAIALYRQSKADSLVSVVRTKRFFWQSDKESQFVRPTNYEPFNRPRRQNFEGQLVENGALYITSRQRLLETRCRISGTIVAYEMPAETYCELDDLTDWTVAETLMKRREQQSSAKAV